MKKARLPRPAEKVSVWHRLTASSFKEEDPSSFEEEDQEEEDEAKEIDGGEEVPTPSRTAKDRGWSNDQTPPDQ